MAAGYSLKDALFNAQSVGYLAGLLREVDPGFDPQFEARVLARFPVLELKARIAWIAECLLTGLPEDFAAAADLVTAALPPPLDPTRRDDDFGQFIFAPLGEWAVLRGLEDHPDRLLDLLEALTQRFSMEFAIRPCLNRHPDAVLTRMSLWAAHPHYHVRRLVSEGTRPRLPWGAGITLAPARALPLLDRLHADPTRFVTRSVANHLNDIARKDPDTVLDRLDRWARQGRQDAAELRWMTAHALRGLVKAGHPGALELLGFRADAPVTATLQATPDRLPIGGKVTLTATLTAAPGSAGMAPVPVLVDVIFARRRADGGTGAKVFKLKQSKVTPGKPLTLTKVLHMRGDATTYALHPGPQALRLQVNGRVLAETAIHLDPAG
ncbi:hypothetical protein [Pseudooceanicola aestuarii]|uniref:hypothetical protein n=1 Tax=Pseudooceanicola aestuarii TaxID=2697319 RepID=UPI0013D3D476|nr:hypothetical protein [Pseudooceanicola aestuarii]